VQTEAVINRVQEAARTKAAQLKILKASTEGEINAVFGALMQLQADALLIGPDVFFFSRREHVVALAARYAVPAMYSISPVVIHDLADGTRCLFSAR
jgi:putative ABC transport system substrate-binding protein